MRRVLLAAAIVLSICAAPAAAAPILFVGVDDPRAAMTNSTLAESAFLAGLVTSGTETMDGILAGTFDPTLTFGATGITATVPNTVVVASGGAISAPNVLLDNSGDEILTLSGLVHGFGTFINGIGTQQTPSILTLVLENTILATSQTVSFGPFVSMSEEAVVFAGVIDALNPFNRVTMHIDQDFDVFRLDDITVGVGAVPEPATFGLIALGLWLGLGAKRGSSGDR